MINAMSCFLLCELSGMINNFHALATEQTPRSNISRIWLVPFQNIIWYISLHCWRIPRASMENSSYLIFVWLHVHVRIVWISNCRVYNVPSYLLGSQCHVHVLVTGCLPATYACTINKCYNTILIVFECFVISYL